MNWRSKQKGTQIPSLEDCILVKHNNQGDQLPTALATNYHNCDGLNLYTLII